MIRHDEPPKERSEPPPDVNAKCEEILSSAYGKYVQKLTPAVKGKTVIRTEAGNSGFILFLGGW